MAESWITKCGSRLIYELLAREADGRGRGEAVRSCRGAEKFGQLFDVPICGHESVERTNDREHFQEIIRERMLETVGRTRFEIADDNKQYSRACDKTIKPIE